MMKKIALLGVPLLVLAAATLLVMPRLSSSASDSTRPASIRLSLDGDDIDHPLILEPDPLAVIPSPRRLFEEGSGHLTTGSTGPSAAVPSQDDDRPGGDETTDSDSLEGEPSDDQEAEESDDDPSGDDHDTGDGDTGSDEELDDDGQTID